MNLAKLHFTQSSSTIETYDFVEITLHAEPDPTLNPFTDVSVIGLLRHEDEQPIVVYGFCDADDGSLHRIRFMADKPGCYIFTVTIQHGGQSSAHTGSFTATPSARKGIVRVDASYPFHFIWEGTGEHYFYNGTTAYLLLSLRADDAIVAAIDRLAGYDINRMRVALSARYGDEICNEPIYASDDFTMILNPWPARDPQSVLTPGFDVTRFNLAFWQKADRMLRHARARDMVISLIFYLDVFQPGTRPFTKNDAPLSEDEKRYFCYAAARFGAFSNVMWDLCNEYRNISPYSAACGADPWAKAIGRTLKSYDPWQHCTSIHGHETFTFRNAPWADFAMHQYWDAPGGCIFMLNNRRLQEASGKIMPQVNEEYGYEHAYPEFPVGVVGDYHEADSRAQLAFEMAMVGCYQTTGERADIPGCGGWVNGCGNDQMRMLEKYQAIYRLITSFEWWKMEPHNELVHQQTLCLAEPGRQYLVYLRHTWRRNTSIRLEPGRYMAEWRDPFSDRRRPIGVIEGPVVPFDNPPTDEIPWAITIRRIEETL